MKRLLLVLCSLIFILPLVAGPRWQCAQPKKAAVAEKVTPTQALATVSVEAPADASTSVDAAEVAEAPKQRKMTAAEARCAIMAGKVALIDRALHRVADQDDLVQIEKAAREAMQMQGLLSMGSDSELAGVEAMLAKSRAVCTGCLSTSFGYSAFITNVGCAFSRMTDLLARINERADGAPDTCTWIRQDDIDTSGSTPGYTINTPGRYCVYEDISYAPTTPPGTPAYDDASAIYITSPGVTLDLCGHKIAVTRGAGSPPSPYGFFGV